MPETQTPWPLSRWELAVLPFAMPSGTASILCSLEFGEGPNPNPYLYTMPILTFLVQFRQQVPKMSEPQFPHL